MFYSFHFVEKCAFDCSDIFSFICHGKGILSALSLTARGSCDVLHESHCYFSIHTSKHTSLCIIKIDPSTRPVLRKRASSLLVETGSATAPSNRPRTSSASSTSRRFPRTLKLWCALRRFTYSLSKKAFAAMSLSALRMSGPRVTGPSPVKHPPRC